MSGLSFSVHPYGIGFENEDDVLVRLGWYWEIKGPDGYVASGKTRRRKTAERELDAAIARYKAAKSLLTPASSPKEESRD